MSRLSTHLLSVGSREVWGGHSRLVDLEEMYNRDNANNSMQVHIIAILHTLMSPQAS